VAQAVSRWPLTTDARLRARAGSCWTCGGQSGTGTGCPPSSSVFPCQYHSTVAVYSHLWGMNARPLGRSSETVSPHRQQHQHRPEADVFHSVLVSLSCL
jgi:hypothetical protein